MRLENTFRSLAEKNQSAFITFLTAGDPDYETSINIINELEQLLPLLPDPPTPVLDCFTFCVCSFTTLETASPL